MVAAMLTALASAPAPALGKAVIGAWECRSGPCIDPEIEFALEDGKRVFRSWLHNHPGSIGEWSFDGKSVSVLCCSSATAWHYTLVRVNKKELVLREEGQKKAAHYRRIP